MLVKKIDIHVHTSESMWPSGMLGARYATPEELIHIYDQIGVEKGLLLPMITNEYYLQITSNYEIKQIVDKHPDRFVWFCNLDPRQGQFSPNTDFTQYISVCKANGAKGVGEICSNLYFDDPLTLNLLRQCEKCEMPVTFHIGDMGGDYGLVDEIGLPRLEKVLQMFPKLTFLGHSQKFWAEISGDLTVEERNGYPTGKVAPGGRVVELLRKYPNLCGDLSAGSGFNAICRDPEFGYAFMEEFQDRLFFGTDICDPRNVTNSMMKLSQYLDEAVENGHISQEAYEKISRRNAEKLLGL